MAEGDDEDQKTEEPSARRLEKAREEGDVPVSQEVKTWFMMLGAVALVAFAAPIAGGLFQRMGQEYLAGAHATELTLDGLQSFFAEVVVDMFLVLGLPFVLMLVLALAGTITQVGWLFTPSKLKFNLQSISPVTGLKRMFSARQLVEFGKGLVKIALVGVVSWVLIAPRFEDPSRYMQQDPRISLEEMMTMILLLVVVVLALMSAIAWIDLSYTRFEYKKKLRMTKKEIRDEHKETEGDPQVKGRIRQLRAERARQRMMSAVPKATVVVTNPTHYAVALSYDMDKMTAPRLVAKGVDHLAMKIREVAEESDVPLVENPPLARALYASVEIDAEVPPEHYKAVAEVISYVYRLNRKRAS